MVKNVCILFTSQLEAGELNTHPFDRQNMEFTSNNINAS